MSRTSSIEIFTVILLHNNGQYLLLQRSPEKKFAPNQWTGIGGRVEADEYLDLVSSALRELEEETGFSRSEVTAFTLRRAVLTNRPSKPLGVILYFTGELLIKALPDCPEGQLAWVDPESFSALDIIETTRPTLPCLVDDMGKCPYGEEPVKTGLAVFNHNEEFERVLWG